MGDIHKLPDIPLRRNQRRKGLDKKNTRFSRRIFNIRGEHKITKFALEEHRFIVRIGGEEVIYIERGRYINLCNKIKSVWRCSATRQKIVLSLLLRKLWEGSRRKFRGGSC